jgi:hypothetical protein
MSLSKQEVLKIIQRQIGHEYSLQQLWRWRKKGLLVPNDIGRYAIQEVETFCQTYNFRKPQTRLRQPYVSAEDAKTAIKECPLSGKQIAELLGISQPTVSQYKKGNLRMSMDTYHRIQRITRFERRKREHRGY